MNAPFLNSLSAAVQSMFPSLCTTTPADSNRGPRPSPSGGALVVEVERNLQSSLAHQADAAEALKNALASFGGYVVTLQKEKAAAEKGFEALAKQNLLLVDVLAAELETTGLSDYELSAAQSHRGNVIHALRTVRIVPMTIAPGMPFSPEKMLALDRIPATQAEGTVVSVSREGFEFRPAQGPIRIMRPAEVVVSAGPVASPAAIRPHPTPLAATQADRKPLLTS